ncbi:PRA1 family protein-domain-containing protein [Rostrohypoxylon terebratum]|nr:PRA1 family protein-domain-containing protein [Rostrohypoxylon terebratum]
MARIQIPLDVLTSRLNIQDRFAGFRNTSLSSRFANMRPVGEFLDFKRLSKPANFGEVQSRVNYNLGTFSSNYALVFVLLSVYALITNPLLLFDIILLVGGLWLLGRLNGQDLTIGTFQATSSQLYTGLLCTCGLLFLIASPFSTVLWLIGASGLGGRPRAPKFAPQWGRPSRRPRRGYEEEEEEGIWGTGRRVVEELLDGEGTDTQGAENGGRRFASDPLRFTGTDLGGGGQVRNGYAYQHSDEEDEDGNSTDEGTQATSEEEEEDTDDEYSAERRELEEALVQSALSRIRKAQSKGRQDVKLNKQELAALDRRRKRLQAEAKASKGGGGRKRKEKEQRYAIPISQFDAPSRGPSGSSESLARKALPSTEQGPPMGRFHPPNASRSRPRSGTSSTSSTQRPQSRIRDSPPFDYQYVNAPPNQRHASDPFQYQTAGPRAPHADSVAVVGSSPKRHRSRARRDESQEDETTSDDAGNREMASPSPESERPKAKKTSPGQPITKKKVASGTGKKRKGK